ncbi:tyrosine-type recombinase/integrase [Nocardioides sp. CCNWLW239]|uniref:tyrosine-type recombinase/integrase n=1 Tax=Nocardioides sp. CCNWLW239 TaxID=3128902 RepID=UPI00301A7680
MTVETRKTASGKKKYNARVFHKGRQVASLTFDRKKDAEAWHDEQVRKLRLGDWFDPRRGQVPLSDVADHWLESLGRLKQSSGREDARNWRRNIEPTFGKVPVGSITSSDVSRWVGGLAASGLKPTTVARKLATFRSLLDYAKEDRRVSTNVAKEVKAPTAGQAKREGQYLTVAEVDALVSECAVPTNDKGTPTGRLSPHGDPIPNPYADLVKVLALGGMRWGEVAGLQLRDRVYVPGRGLRLQRAVLANSDTGELYEETLKGHRARTVPLVDDIVPIIDRWCEGKGPDDWIFTAPRTGSGPLARPGGSPLHERNWKRSIGWSAALRKIGRNGFRVHDLRHTCASVWLGAGADPKVVQRILGHSSATMTMDLYGHLIDQNLWDAAAKVAYLSLTSKASRRHDRESKATADSKDGKEEKGA